MNVKKEIVDAIQVIVDSAIKKTCPVITFGVVTNVGQKNHCTVQINQIDYNIKYYGEDAPSVNQKYPVFMPFNKMPLAFIISGGTGGGGETSDYNQLSNRPSINNIVLSGNKTSSQLGLFDGNYNNLSNKPTIPDKTSQLTNDSGFVTSSALPPATTTTPKMNGTANVGSETKYARGDHVHPIDTSRQAALNTAQLNAVNSGVTSSKISTYDGYAGQINGKEPSITSGATSQYWRGDKTWQTLNKSAVGLGNVDNVKQYSASNPPPYPITSVNGQTGIVVLGLSDLNSDATHRTVTDTEKATWNAKASNPNLCDNPVFSVNQRGSNSYTSSGTITPSFDRWLIQRGTITKSQNGGATFQWSGDGSDGYLLQRYEDELGIKLAGKTITISVIVDGEVIQVSGVAPSKGGTDIDIITESVRLRYRWLVDSQTSVNRPEFMVNFLDVNIHNITGIKLELGSMSTIVNDVPPDYASELLKCLRYFERISSADSNNISVSIGIGSSSVIYIPVKIAPKRTTAVMTYSALSDLKLGASSSLNITPTSVGLFSQSLNGVVTIRAFGSFTDKQPYRFGVVTGGYLDFSAEL